MSAYAYNFYAKADMNTLSHLTVTKTYTITLLEENMLEAISISTGRKKSDVVREGIALVYKKICCCLEREGDNENCVIHQNRKLGGNENGN